MPYSLGLTLYNLSARRDAATPVVRPDRPAGRLIWIHSPTSEAQKAMGELARRLIDEDGHPVLLTGPEGAKIPAGAIFQTIPSDTPADARAFLDHWRPEAVIMAEGELRPALLSAVLERGLPVALVNCRAPSLPRDRSGWWPGLIRGLLAEIPHVWTLDEAGARAFRKAGSPAAAIVAAGRMEESSVVLPASESDRLALAHLMGTRPVWFANNVPEAEESAVIDTHRAGLRLAHRLLLIMAPQDARRAEPLVARMTETEGWSVSRRAKDEEPDSETEVYLVEPDSEYGLWYRLAPITYLGGSLSSAGCQRDPLEAAALGSAIIHGPRPGTHGVIFGRLGAALAARSVASSSDLTEALGDLLSPDKAARLAQAAWDVASDGAEVTDRVVGLVRKMLGEDA
jgi:3-deoxy-D-manno-octulosonic-acid transferase